MPLSSFWSEEVRDLKSKLRLLGIVFLVVLPPAAGLLWIGVSLWLVNLLAVVIAALLGLLWVTVRMWDDFQWGSPIDWNVFSKERQPRSTSTAPRTSEAPTAAAETEVMDLSRFHLHTIEHIAAVFRVRPSRAQGSTDEPVRKQDTPPRVGAA